MSLARDRQNRGASASPLSRRPNVIESRCVGCTTQKPEAAPADAKGPYPFSEDRCWEGPCPCDSTTTGRCFPLTGAVTLT